MPRFRGPNRTYSTTLSSELLTFAVDFTASPADGGLGACCESGFITADDKMLITLIGPEGGRGEAFELDFANAGALDLGQWGPISGVELSIKDLDVGTVKAQIVAGMLEAYR